MLGNSICIERKEGNDFLQSIRDRRIWEQASNMSQYESPIICIITGDIWRDFYFSQSNWIHKSYLGAIASLTTSYGISVLTFDTDDDFIDYITQIEKQVTSDKTSSRPKPLMRKARTSEEIKENILSMIPGVGIKTSQQLLEKYKTIENICDAKIEQLQEIPKIGEKVAKRIYESLH